MTYVYRYLQCTKKRDWRNKIRVIFTCSVTAMEVILIYLLHGRSAAYIAVFTNNSKKCRRLWRQKNQQATEVCSPKRAAVVEKKRWKLSTLEKKKKKQCIPMNTVTAVNLTITDRIIIASRCRHSTIRSWIRTLRIQNHSRVQEMLITTSTDSLREFMLFSGPRLQSSLQGYTKRPVVTGYLHDPLGYQLQETRLHRPGRHFSKCPTPNSCTWALGIR